MDEGVWWGEQGWPAQSSQPAELELRLWARVCVWPTKSAYWRRLKNPHKDTPNLVESIYRRAEAVTASKGWASIIFNPHCSGSVMRYHCRGQNAEPESYFTPGICFSDQRANVLLDLGLHQATLNIQSTKSINLQYALEVISRSIYQCFFKILENTTLPR